MMETYLVKNKTSGGTQTINVIVNKISVEELLSCASENQIRDLCRLGCVNYGKKWCCPPLSPEITNLTSKRKYENAIIICGYIYIKDMDYIKNPYQKVKAANMILKSYCEKKARKLEVELNGYSLLSGSCNLCKPCHKKRGEPCGKPHLRRYSLESTGINVGQLVETYCNHSLVWYKKGDKIEYTSVVVAVLI